MLKFIGFFWVLEFESEAEVDVIGEGGFMEFLVMGVDGGGALGF